MNKHHIHLFVLCTLYVLLAASCKQEQEDAFDQSASTRMQSILDEMREQLIDSEYGWELEYYPSSTLDYGGIVYTIKFDRLNATVGCSLVPGQTETSLYRLTNDSGPVLTFDSYNSLLHYFSTPSPAAYEALGGEFEFVISNITHDVITLYGKRTRNTMYLRRLTASPDEYAQKTVDIYDNFVSSFSGTIDGIDVQGKCELSDKSIKVSYGGREQTLHFTYNDRGIRLYEPFTVGSKTVQTFAFDKETNMLTCIDEGQEGVTLQGVPFGDDIVHFKDYEGRYTLRYNKGSSTQISLVPSRIDGTYRMQGLSSKYELILYYDYSNGHLLLGPQIVGEIDGHSVYFCTYNPDGSGLWLTGDAMMSIAWNGNKYYSSYLFSPTFPNIYNCNSGVLVIIYTDADGELNAQLVDDPEWLVNNSPTLLNLTSLVRVRE